jgi:beta-glucanase (GH16 family)
MLSYQACTSGLKPPTRWDRINGMSEFARKSARRRRLVVGPRRPSGRHVRSPVRDGREGSVSTMVGDGGGGPDAGDSSGASDGHSEVPPGRISGGSRAAWLGRARGWSPAFGLLGKKTFGLFGVGIGALTVRLATVVTLALLSLVAVPLAVATLTSASPSAPGGWTTVFSDVFAGPAGSGAGPAWTEDTGDQYHGGGCQAQWGTGEVDTDTSSAANVSADGSGHLNITPVDINGAWASGRIETVQDFTPPAGGQMQVSASIKQPGPASGLGYWAAFWMLGADYRVSGAGTSGTMNCASWPSVGEVNIMEDVNAQSQVSGTLHCGTALGGPCNEGIGLTSGLQSCPGCQTGYNTYSVIINRVNPADESITWYLNGNAFHTVTESQVGAATWQKAVDHGFFLILDVGIGGNYPNGACDCTTPSGQTTSGAPMSVGDVTVQTTTGTGTITPSSPVAPAPSPTASVLPSVSPPASLLPSVSPSASAHPSPSLSVGHGHSRTCTQNATADISADCTHGSSRPVSVFPASGDTSPAGTDGNQIARLANGDWLEYPRVNFGSGSTQFDARVASGASPGVSGLVEVVLDRVSNAPVGSFAVASTGGWNSWRTIPANMAKVTGIHKVFLKFYSTAPGAPPFVSLHYFTFPVT